MALLRQGVTGPEVKALQKQLHAIGYSTIEDNGRFDPKTDQAVRVFQTKQGLLPDGIVGKRTREALDKAQANPGRAVVNFQHLVGLLGAPLLLAALVARSRSSAQVRGAYPPASLKTSEKGIRFIYREEAQKGVSNVLHWPGGVSGVTLGPGYDMKERTEKEISADLRAIGIPEEAAVKAAEGAGLKGEQAKEFVAKFNKDRSKLININYKKEIALLKHVVPKYERNVKNVITVDLYQYQFDALVCFAYNPAGELRNVANYINRGEVRAALDLISIKNKSGGVVMKGLTDRRRREVALYAYGDYGTLPTID